MAITRNHALLLAVVAELFAMLRGNDRALPLYREAGSEGRARPVARPGSAASQSEAVRARQPDKGNANASTSANFTLPRHLYAAILLILRPCESAIRRLIIIAARGLILKPHASRPFPAGVTSFAVNTITRSPVFQLIDPLKDFPLDAFDNDPQPSSSVMVAFNAALAYQQAQSAALPVNAALLFNRLRAMRQALNDLPRQSRRLARWRAQRDLALAGKGPFKPTRMSPFRPGPPPGYRRKDIHQVDAVLKDVHYFAIEAFRKPESS